MTFEGALRTRLKNDATVAGRVGTRIHWFERPQGSPYPCIVVSPFYGSRDKHMKGVSGTQRMVVQVSIFSESAEDVFAIRDAAVRALEPPALVGGINFQGGTADLGRGKPKDVATATIKEVIFDIELWFNEGV